MADVADVADGMVTTDARTWGPEHRALHPGAWWLWALGLAVAAGFTTNPLTLLALAMASAVVVFARRGDQPWADSYRLYVGLAVVIVLMRVLFRLLFAGGYPGTVWIPLPSIPLPDFVLGIHLLGDATRESLLFGLYDGLRLATIVVCVGAANSLANPKRLLKSVPAALYEIGTALVVAVTVLPQLADSLRRVRAARDLRGGATGRIAGLRRLLVPVLEDALERSMSLAAGMDTRGYGRSGQATPRQRTLTGALMLAGLCGLCVGIYATLDTTSPDWLATPMLVVGSVLAVTGMVTAGQRVHSTRYRPDSWRAAELVTACCGVMVAALSVWVSHNHVAIASPALDVVPTLHVVLLVAVVVAVAPALITPRAPRTEVLS